MKQRSNFFIFRNIAETIADLDSAGSNVPYSSLRMQISRKKNFGKISKGYPLRFLSILKIGCIFLIFRNIAEPIADLYSATQNILESYVFAQIQDTFENCSKKSKGFNPWIFFRFS